MNKFILTIILVAVGFSLLGQAKQSYVVTTNRDTYPEKIYIRNTVGLMYYYDIKSESMFAIYMPNSIFQNTKYYYINKIFKYNNSTNNWESYFAFVVKSNGNSIVFPLLCYRKSTIEIKKHDKSYNSAYNITFAYSRRASLSYIDSISHIKVNLPQSSLAVIQASTNLHKYKNYLTPDSIRLLWGITPFQPYISDFGEEYIKNAFSFIQLSEKSLLKKLLGNQYHNSIVGIDVLLKSALVYNSSGNLVLTINQNYSVKNNSENDPLLLTTISGKFNQDYHSIHNMPYLYDSLNFDSACVLYAFNHIVNFSRMSQLDRYSYFNTLDSTIISILRESEKHSQSHNSTSVKIYSPVLPFYKRWWAKMFHYLSW